MVKSQTAWVQLLFEKPFAFTSYVTLHVPSPLCAFTSSSVKWDHNSTFCVPFQLLLNKLPPTLTEKHSFIHNSVGEKPGGLDCVLCAGSHKAKIKVSARLGSYQRSWRRIDFQAYSGCWQNSVLCGCKTEIPIFLLAVGWGSVSAPRNHTLVLSQSLFHIQARMESLCFISLCCPLLLLKGSCDYIGPTQIITL